jgi:aspartyl-tRNA(Asn)/glutamyl-tRNA(Gln) amidotransferase subunit A
MTIEAWLKAAVADAEERGLPELKPLLEGLAASTSLLRRADFNQRADGTDLRQRDESSHSSGGKQPTSREASRPVHLAVRPPAAGRQSQSDSPHLDEFGRRLRAGSTSALETTEACLRRIEESNEALNAFILVMGDEARQQAREADAELAAGHDRGPLHGVPVSVKDLFDIRGHATTAASNVRRGHVAAHDADAVIHLRRAGAIIVGKTNLHEFAFGTTNEDSAFGAAHHPLNLAHSPGGSSGGSAVSVAAGMALATLGTDTGGSIRIPSAACGLVGLKPTIAETSTDGVVPLSATLDHVGPLARSVTDAWHVHQALLGRPMSRPLVPRPLSGIRLGVPARYFCDVLQPDVRAQFELALEKIRGTGATIDEVDIAHADFIATIYMQLVFGEAAAYHAATLESQPHGYTEAVRLRLELARYVLAEDYHRAMAGRRLLQREVDAALAACEAMLLPTLPITAPRIGEANITIDGTTHPVRNLMLRQTQLFNVTGHPAVSLPTGGGENGLPVGLQVVGRHYETNPLMQTALAIELALSNPDATDDLTT